jgi:hypothetical protein
MSKYEKG